MDLGIKDRIALVCGASKGIGWACAKVLADEGVKVILLARSGDLLKERVKELQSRGKIASFIEADLTYTQKLPDIVKQANSIYGQIDILINNAGGPPAGENLSFHSGDWEDAFRLTFLSTEELTRLILPSMAERGWGRIVNLTSVSVIQPVNSLILSNSIRMAIIGYAKTLSLEFAGKGITINNIATGYTFTKRIDELAENRSKSSGKGKDDVIKDMEQSIPARRMAKPEEIGYAVAFLSSDRASYITGMTLPIDGGIVKKSL
jgi:3-oxoacyl-[acyl-carrier protein] reductase